MMRARWALTSPQAKTMLQVGAETGPFMQENAVNAGVAYHAISLENVGSKNPVKLGAQSVDCLTAAAVHEVRA